jgi:signal transduction histidine kinase
MASPSNPVPDPLAEVLRENQELRSSLDRYVAAANSTGEQLQQFLYAASHDLQEPLRAVITYAQLLDRHFSSDPAAHEYIGFVLDGAVRMRELLQHLLAYSRAGSSRQRNVKDLNVPLQMALLKLGPDITHSSAHIIRNPLPEALCDEGEIALVFENLLSNSLKFRSTAAPVIAVTAEQGSDECTVSFRDNGLGIEPRYCDQALLPFKRIHSRSIPGSGLGLAICEKIIRAHDGRLWLESDGIHGTTVRFTLPL